jgi:hypothetical protein
MRKPLVVAAVLAVVLATAVARPGAQAPAAPSAAEYGRAPKLETQPFAGPNGRIKFEYPKKDWQIVPGGSSVIVSLAQKKGEAAVVVEQTRLNQALAPDDITDLFGQLESDTVKEHQPSATDLRAKVVDASGRRFIIVDYARKGVAGPERVRQYSFPVGADLYRLTCSAATAQFPRYESVFAHLAATFSVTGAGTAP